MSQVQERTRPESSTGASVRDPNILYGQIAPPFLSSCVEILAAVLLIDIWKGFLALNFLSLRKLDNKEFARLCTAGSAESF